MILEGTIVKGRVELDEPANWPDGARVRVKLECEDELDDLLDDMPIPPPTETYEEHLEILRKSIEESRAGDTGMTVAEAFAEVRAEVVRMEKEASRT
ncbi:MAG TPA: hypothetical protein VGI99_00590 [Gemmataceae bacterium]|jgi:hypothetical protein